MKLENYVKLYYIQWQKIEKQKFIFSLLCKNVKENKIKYTNNVCRVC